MNNLKIAVIGGGSSYTPELIEGFLKRYDELPVNEIWLVDISEGQEKLSIIFELAQRMIKKQGLPIQLFATLDRLQAIKDADFVLTQFRVGQLDARELDEKIPLEHGMLGQETTGAGGLFKALRTVPVIMDIIKDMEEVAPDAWLVNFTNPVSIVSETIHRYTDFQKMIGVCNVPISMINEFADVLQRKPKEIIPTFAGMNHLSYAIKVDVNGVDYLDTVIDSINKRHMTMKNIDPLEWDYENIKKIRAYPGPYQKYYFYPQKMLEKTFESYRNNNVRAVEVKKIEKVLFEKYKDPNLDVKPPELEQRGGAFYSDVACSIISAIYNDKNEYHVVNTVNNGVINELPFDCAVEILTTISKEGPKQIDVPKLPEKIVGLLQKMKSYEMKVAKAIHNRNLQQAKEALREHPLTVSTEISDTVFDELVKVHKKYLTQYRTE